MKENWAAVVPYLAMITGVQFGITGVAKVIGAAPYKKLDRLGKTIEAAVSLATGTMLVILFVESAKLTEADTEVLAEERLWLAREWAFVYATVFAIFLVWGIAIVFGKTRWRIGTLLLTVFSIVAVWAETLGPDGRLWLEKSVQSSIWVLLAGIAAVFVFRLLPIPIQRRIAEVFLARRRRFVQWLEPSSLNTTAAPPTDSHTSVS